MGVKSAFNNVSKAQLGSRMEMLDIEPDLIRWTQSFMTDRQVKLVLDGKSGEANPVDTGIPQGSPAAPILFVMYLSGIFDTVEAAVPGIRGLSFVEGISWWADGKDDKSVAEMLSAAARASIEWAAGNGVVFDHGKTEAALFHRKRKTPTATVKVGTNTVPFNEATRWLGVWLDSQLTLKDHHAIRLKDGKKAMARLRRLTGQMGLSSANCRKVMTACIQSVAMFGSELWWKGDHGPATKGRAEESQPGVLGDHGLLPDNQLGGSLDGVWPPSSSDTAGKPAAAVQATVAESAAGRPGTGDYGDADRARPATYECPYLRRKHGENGGFGGTRNLRRGAAAGGGRGSKSGLPRSLANLKREISEKKWAEARQRAGGRTSKAKYRMPKSQKPDGAVAGRTKRLASRFYQIKTGHCLTGQYLNWTKNWATPQCWWCRYPHQTREHLFKECPEWKTQQKILWAEVWKETGRWKSQWKIRDLLADERCGQAVLDFLSTTDVGRRVPDEEEDAVSAVSELEVREWLNEQGAGAEEAGAGGTRLFLPTPDFMASAGTV